MNDPLEGHVPRVTPEETSSFKVPVDGHILCKIDLSSIEERVLSSYVPDPITRLALRLPRKHPMRFALLYGVGPRSLERMAAKAIAGPDTDIARLRPFLEAIRLECEIEGFENWQSNTAEDAALRHRRENATIAYAAVEAGLISPERGIKAVREVGATFQPKASLTPTGRRWSAPEIQWLGSATGRWKPGDAHTYPEDGILRD